MKAFLFCGLLVLLSMAILVLGEDATTEADEGTSTTTECITIKGSKETKEFIEDFNKGS
jgi:hypothetical protein